MRLSLCNRWTFSLAIVFFFLKDYFNRAPQRPTGTLLPLSQPVTVTQVYLNVRLLKRSFFETIVPRALCCWALTGGFSGHEETSGPHL